MSDKASAFDSRYRREAEFVGGYSIVHQAYDTMFGRYVAIKTPSDVVMRSPRLLTAFIEEARVLERLKHENIVSVEHFYAQGEVDDRCHLVMEWLDQSLEKVIENETLSWEAALRVALAIVSGVRYLHEQNIVHNDIKLANVLCSKDLSSVKIADLGVASGVIGDMTQRATFKYAAPESFSGTPGEGPASDVYSLGMCLYELFLGKEAFQAVLSEIYAPSLQGNPNNRWLSWHLDKARTLPPLSEVNGKIPTFVSDAVASMTEKDPIRRFRDLKEVELALTVAGRSEAEGHPEEARPEVEGAPARQSRGTTNWLLWGSIIASIVVAIAILVVTVIQQDDTRLPPVVVDPVLLAELEELARHAQYLQVANSSADFAEGMAGVTALREQHLDDSTEVRVLLESSIERLQRAISSAPRNVSLGTDASQMQTAIALCRVSTLDCSADDFEDESPRTALISPFELDFREVTNAEFDKFVQATSHLTDAEQNGYLLEWQGSASTRVTGASWHTLFLELGPGAAQYPVRGVSYLDAKAYCAWAGRRLPSSEEWEYAARGPGTPIFAWGNGTDPGDFEWPGTFRPVDQLPITGYFGLSGLAGSVWEWVDGGSSDARMLRGASWRETDLVAWRWAVHRIQDETSAHTDDGFRCARDAERWPAEAIQ